VSLILPMPSEMPDRRITELRELLQTAEDRLHSAQERLMWVDNLIRQGVRLGHKDSMTLRVLQGTRAHEVELWDREVAQLVERARALGLQA
jgi:hypothetical protein